MQMFIPALICQLPFQIFDPFSNSDSFKQKFNISFAYTFIPTSVFNQLIFCNNQAILFSEQKTQVMLQRSSEHTLMQCLFHSDNRFDTRFYF